MTQPDNQMCIRCVMDQSDPEIAFDADGVCNHCIEFDSVTRKHWHPNDEGARLLAGILDRIKAAGSGKEYDCILGLSGGVDSSYLALKVHEWGLRPLVVHVDAGWNSELAVANIESIVRHGGFDLHTHVVNWEEIRDLQVAYLRAGVANQDAPQDHVFFATLYRFAVDNGIRYILSGGNLATEAIFPRSWHHSAMDAINLRDIHRQYGAQPLRTYPTIGFLNYYIGYPLLRGMRTVRPLNYLNYVKTAAVMELEQKTSWRKYERKHGESIFTKWFQNYYLPTRFGFDKRKPHLSSLIASGQLARDAALAELQKPLYEEQELEQDTAYICKKLRISREQLDSFMHAPLREATEFRNWESRKRVLKRLQRMVERVSGRRIAVYS